MNLEFTDFRASAALPAVFDAWWFDGQSARAHAARLHFRAGAVVLESAEGELIAQRPLTEADITLPYRHAARQLSFADGATVQVDDPDGRFAAALGEHGYRPSWATRLERFWPGVFLALMALLASLYFGYTRGIPAASTWIVDHLPDSVEQRIGAELVATFDGRYLFPSRLPEDLRTSIADRFAQVAHTAAPGVHYKLIFRRAKGERRGGINAFALPGGTIVLLDGLVDFADEDLDQIVGVLSHELGHVAHRHGMHNVVSALSTGAMASLVWGDFSGVATHAGLVVGVLKYSRDAEREADQFAIDVAHANHTSVKPLYDFLMLVQSELEGKEGNLPNLLATHPDTDERLNTLAREINAEETGRSSAPPVTHPMD